MKHFSQRQTEKLRKVLEEIVVRTLPEQFEYFEHLIVEQPINIDMRVPNCALDYLGITGKGATLNIATIAWIASARATLAQIDGGLLEVS